MADVFELELHDLHEEDPNRGPDSDDDIIEVDEVSSLIFIYFFSALLECYGLCIFAVFYCIWRHFYFLTHGLRLVKITKA